MAVPIASPIEPPAKGTLARKPPSSARDAVLARVELRGGEVEDVRLVRLRRTDERVETVDEE
jgi:hypothetical protein